MLAELELDMCFDQHPYSSSIGVLLSCFCRTVSSFCRPVSLASSSVILTLVCATFSFAFWWHSHSVEVFSSTSLTSSVLGDNLFSAPKLSWSSANSNLGHLRHFSDSNCLPVLETLQRTSYSEPLLAVPNATTHSFHSNPSPNTPSEGCSESSTSSEGNPETSLDSAPSDLKSGLMFFRNPPSRSGDRATPTASDIKGWVVKVIHDVKGRWWSGSMGNAGRWPWS